MKSLAWLQRKFGRIINQ